LLTLYKIGRGGVYVGKVRRSRMFVLLGMLALLAVTVPAAAQTTPQDPPTLSVSDRLDDRRYVAAGSRGYIVGAETGRFPAMGWHIQGEMGGIWSPPIKLLDGLWFGVDGEWLAKPPASPAASYRWMG
jgi:hypothetical protein